MFNRFLRILPVKQIKKLASDRRGVAAVEFAIIAPLLIMLYLMMVEASQAIDTNKKLDRATYTVADLITQQSTTSKTEIEHVLTLGRNMLRPYNRSQAQISVAMYRKSGSNGAMQWWSSTATSFKPPVSDPNPPSSLATGDLYLKAVVNLQYVPILTYTEQTRDDLNLANFNIPMGSTRVLVPRTADTLCSDCDQS